MDDDSTPRRRFALVIGWVLFLFTNAGVELDTPLKLTVFGIQLVITTPQIVSWGLFLTAAYAFARYFYYDMVLKMSPIRARRLILQGKLPETELTGPGSLDAQVTEIMKRYFPGLKKQEEWKYDAPMGHFMKFEIVQMPKRVKVVYWLENLDFLLPLIVSGMAMGGFLINIIWERLHPIVTHL